MLEDIGRAFGLLLGGDPELWQIIGVTLQMSLCSTAISCAIGLPLGVLIGAGRFRGRGVVMRVLSTLMGIPPVVAGLVVFLLLSRSGPLGSLQLLFTLPAMVIAQVILITPIIAGLSATAAADKHEALAETAQGLGIPRRKKLWLVLRECRSSLVSVGLTGFGRAISEVGAVQIVGGNIQFSTRVMTTAIMLETNKGNFEFAVALGIILLLMSFAINAIAYTLKGRMS